MARIIESPGVQISEIDLSLNASLPVGTNILINGFTDQGPSQELLNITSIVEYEQIYGVPTNAAERYSYHTMKSLLSTPAKVVFNRLPYGIDGGDGYNDTVYTALAYPVYTRDDLGETTYSDAISGDLYIGRPTQYQLSEAEYIDIQKGKVQWSENGMRWAEPITTYPLSGAGFVILNKIQTSVNQDYEGYYIGLSDNSKSTTTGTTVDVEFDSITSIFHTKDTASPTVDPQDWNPISTKRLDFKLTGNITNMPDSISEAVETVPSWDFGSDEYNDGVIFGLYKLNRSGYAQDQNALKFVQSEGFIGSFGADRKYTNPTGFQETSFFIETLVNDDSNFMEIIVNPNLAKGNWLDSEGKPNKNMHVLNDEERDNMLGNTSNSIFDFELDPHFNELFPTTDGRYGYDNTVDGYKRFVISGGGEGVIYYSSNMDRWLVMDPADSFAVYGYADGPYDEHATTPPINGWAISGVDVPREEISITNIISSKLNAVDNCNSAFAIGAYTDKIVDIKEIGNVSSKLKLGLRLAEDYEVIPLSLVLDAGLSTIHTTMKVQQETDPTIKEFDDSKVVDIDELLDPATGVDSNVTEAWLTIFNQFDIFCRDTRKDCMFIADVYRNILVKGKDAKVLDNKSRNFSQHVYTPLKNLTAKCNSSYSATYAQWIKVYDGQTSDYAWIPYSGFQGAIMSRLDSVLYPWSAPAGLENGLVVGALSLALPTTQKQRDLLYRNNLNAVVLFPSDGMVCWGQKTLQKKPSAFDRINVRRLFLTLETSTRSLMKYFVFQPNSTFTRSRVVNILTPIFDVAKHNEGVYDYLIVCDERNNTPAVIDNNELQVDIYLKPVRTAEFILVNFYATRTDQNFNELI